MIADKKLYPVTILPSLPKLLLPILAQKNIILAQDLLTYEAKDMVNSFGITIDVAEKLISEVSDMVGDAYQKNG